MRTLAWLLLLLSTPAAAQSVHDRIYPAPTAPLRLDGLGSAAFVTVTTADGLTLKGIEVPPRNGQPLLLVFHGNGSSAMDTMRWFAPLIAQGYGVLAAEYRGYSGSPGRADEPGLTADAEAFHARAQALAAGAPVYVVGHSLGAGVAFLLAERHKLDALVTIGAFTRLRDMTAKITRAFVPDAYRNVDRVAALDEPWFLVHGLRDGTVPASHGNALHSAASKAGRRGASFVLETADHHPEGAAIAAVIGEVTNWLKTGSFAPGFPATMHIVPFGGTGIARESAGGAVK